MFLPVSREEMEALGWDAPDVILITGDAYIDSPFIGAALIGKVLMNAGYRTALIPQPDIHSEHDIIRLGEPKLFWGVTSGCMDSMIANYTAGKKKRRQDDLTAGGQNTRRPDRALIVFCGLIRRYWKNTRPIIIGGLEAGLRRISHYDYHQNSIRRSILCDARADILVYGMAERTIVELADRLAKQQPVTDVRGLCLLESQPRPGYIELLPHQKVSQDKSAFRDMFLTFYEHANQEADIGLYQQQDTRYLIHNPPQPCLTPAELDQIYELDFEREAHPCHDREGIVPGVETFRSAITTHRGCVGQCHFCSIALHQGRSLISRSQASILREARNLSQRPGFKGIISDIGGPTANMFGMYCQRQSVSDSRDGKPCKKTRCLTPKICPHLAVNHEAQIQLLRQLRKIPEIRHAFIASGVRHDLILADKQFGKKYLAEIIRWHISGQLKLAPEHCSPHVLKLMGKPEINVFKKFKQEFDHLNQTMGKRQYLTCYFMAAYPGCTLEDMRAVQKFSRQTLKFKPEQVQIFTPTPSTIASLMYYTQTNPFTGEKLFVETDMREKEKQKRMN